MLTGKKGLVVGVANEHSLAYGCARCFRAAGADLAITYLDAKTERYVHPIASDWAARSLAPATFRSLDSSKRATFLSSRGEGFGYSSTDICSPRPACARFR